MRYRLLVAEDEPRLQETLEDYFTAKGFEAACISGFPCPDNRRGKEACFIACASARGAFVYAIYLLIPAFLVFLFLFVKSLAAALRERRTGRGVPDYPADDVVIAWVCAFVLPFLMYFLEK